MTVDARDRYDVYLLTAFIPNKLRLQPMPSPNSFGNRNLSTIMQIAVTRPECRLDCKRLPTALFTTIGISYVNDRTVPQLRWKTINSLISISLI